jgi:hypothetical protein
MHLDMEAVEYKTSIFYRKKNPNWILSSFGNMMPLWAFIRYSTQVFVWIVMATPSLIHSHQVKPSDGRVNMAHHSELLQKYMTCNRVMRFCLTTLSLIKPLSQISAFMSPWWDKTSHNENIIGSIMHDILIKSWCDVVIFYIYIRDPH